MGRWIDARVDGARGWWDELSFRTASSAVGAVRYEPRRLVLSGGSRLGGVAGSGTPDLLRRVSTGLDHLLDGWVGRLGAQLGENAESWLRWLSGAAGGLLDNVGAGALEEIPFQRRLGLGILTPHEHAVGVLVIDMRGFSKLTVDLRDTQELTARIEEYLAAMTRVVELHHGIVFQYTGDGLLALFLSELTRKDGGELVEHLAGPVARDLQAAFDDLHERWRTSWDERGIRAPHVGLAVGASYGVGTIGLVGPPRRKYFGIVGPPVNLASFLCSKAAAGTLLIDEDSFRLTGAARPPGSRTIRLDSDKLHQRVTTVQI